MNRINVTIVYPNLVFNNTPLASLFTFSPVAQYSPSRRGSIPFPPSSISCTCWTGNRGIFYMQTPKSNSRAQISILNKPVTIVLYTLASDNMSDTRHTSVMQMAQRGMPSNLPQGDTKMQRVTLRLPEQQLKMIDMLVEYGEFPSASEAIRTAIRDLIDQRSEKLVGRMKLFEKAQEQSETVETFLRLKKEQ